MLHSHQKYAKYLQKQPKKISQSSQLNLTPSSKNKYDSYTPRKRYIKEQEQFNNYRQHQEQIAHHFSAQISPQKQNQPLYSSRIRKSMIGNRKANEQTQIDKFQQTSKNQYNSNLYHLQSPLNDSTSMVNCPASIRKTKFKNYLQGKQISKKLSFENYENKDSSNFSNNMNKSNDQFFKPKFLDYEGDACLTPRRLNRKIQQNDMSQKFSIIQAKLTKLQRMTPTKRSATPKQSRIVEHRNQHQYQYYVEREENRIQKESVVTSRVSIISEKQNELMSRVSLGRLVEEQEHQTEIEVIQDLSYKISSKLQSIIRHFG